MRNLAMRQTALKAQQQIARKLHTAEATLLGPLDGTLAHACIVAANGQALCVASPLPEPSSARERTDEAARPPGTGMRTRP